MTDSLGCIMCEKPVTQGNRGYVALPNNGYVCWPCLDDAATTDGIRTVIIDSLKPIPIQTIILGDRDDAERLFGDGNNMTYIEVAGYE